MKHPYAIVDFAALFVFAMALKLNSDYSHFECIMIIGLFIVIGNLNSIYATCRDILEKVK